MLSTQPQSAEADVGALRLARGVVAKLNDPENTMHKYNVACQALCYFFVGASVLARLYTKVFIRPGLRMEDCKAMPYVLRHHPRS